MTTGQRLTSIGLGIGMAALVASAGFAGKPPTDWRTRAEVSGFRATSSYRETLDFLDKLAGKMPEMKLASFGRSAEGRRLPLVIVSGDRAFDPRAAAAAGKPVVLIQNGIHAGEIDGKDASLMILRDLALGRRRELVEAMTLLVVPIYNVDGHERISRFNRPNQDGPREGMGFRTTADGHDLNRDHLKLETAEARAMIGLFNAWRPHLHVDNHVTNGADHDWVLTYSWAEAPQAPPSIDSWLATHMPVVAEATRAAGHRVGPYVSLLDRGDPAKGFSSYVGEPRYATGYYPLRNRPSVLVENHAYKPYERRVLANRDFLESLLQAVARDPRSLVAAVAVAEKRTVSSGKPDAPASRVVLRYEAGEATEKIDFPVYEWTSEPSTVLGAPLLRYRRGRVREIRVPWVHRPEVALSISRPKGYLVLPGWPIIERRLRDHGLRVETLARPVELEVETIRLSMNDSTRKPGASYQGLTRIAPGVARRVEPRKLPSGTLWVPADQPDFEIAVQLLEPEAPDSLVSWGLLSIVLERKEYIAPRVLEPLALKMLKDPETAQRWERALEDQSFAADRWARYDWWYRRTEYWDETVGLMPVMRLLSRPAFETSAPEAASTRRPSRDNP